MALALSALGCTLLLPSWWIILEDFPGSLEEAPALPSGPGPRDEGAQDSGYSNDVSPSGTLASSGPRRPCGATEPTT